MKKKVQISKEVQLDAGHRVPKHQGQCSNPHGHRYRVILYATGHIVEEAGSPDEGMLVDFGDLKKILTQKVHDPLDHGFIVYRRDEQMLSALCINTPGQGELADDVRGKNGWKVIIFPFIPTAENIARWVYEQCLPELESRYSDHELTIDKIEVWETPTSMATYPVGE